MTVAFPLPFAIGVYALAPARSVLDGVHLGAFQPSVNLQSMVVYLVVVLTGLRVTDSSYLCVTL